MASECKTNPSDTEAPLFDLVLSITNGIVSTKIHDKLDYINFEIVNFSFEGDAPPPPPPPSYGVYIRNLAYSFCKSTWKIQVLICLVAEVPLSKYCILQSTLRVSLEKA